MLSRSSDGGCSSVGRVQDCGSCCRGFDPRHPPICENGEIGRHAGLRSQFERVGVRLPLLAFLGRIMNSNELNVVVDKFLELGGDGILEVDIVDSESSSILAGYKQDESTSLVFNELYGELEKTLGDSGFIKDLDYYYLTLEDNVIWLIGKIGESYKYFVLIDSSKVKLGLFFKYLKELREDEN